MGLDLGRMKRVGGLIWLTCLAYLGYAVHLWAQEIAIPSAEPPTTRELLIVSIGALTAIAGLVRAWMRRRERPRTDHEERIARVENETRRLRRRMRLMDRKADRHHEDLVAKIAAIKTGFDILNGALNRRDRDERLLRSLGEKKEGV